MYYINERILTSDLYTHMGREVKACVFIEDNSTCKEQSGETTSVISKTLGYATETVKFRPDLELGFLHEKTWLSPHIGIRQICDSLLSTWSQT